MTQMECYFTGLPLNKDPNSPFFRTMEHLICQAYGGTKDHAVMCSRVVNEAMGNAPMKVKMEIKEKLNTVSYYGDDETIAKTIVKIINEHLEYYKIQYKSSIKTVHIKFPWLWKEVFVVDKKPGLVLLLEYLKLLNREERERFVDAIFKRKQMKDLRVFLEKN